MNTVTTGGVFWRILPNPVEFHPAPVPAGISHRNERYPVVFDAPVGTPEGHRRLRLRKDGIRQVTHTQKVTASSLFNLVTTTVRLGLAPVDAEIDRSGEGTLPKEASVGVDDLDHFGVIFRQPESA